MTIEYTYVNLCGDTVLRSATLIIPTSSRRSCNTKTP